MREKNIMMENGQPLSEELLKIPAEQFEMIERAEEIVDADFRTESCAGSSMTRSRWWRRSSSP